MATKIIITETKPLDDQLAKISVFLRLNVLKKAARAAGNVVRDAARKRAPRSAKTGTRRKWSAKMRAARASVPPYADEIKVVVRDYGRTVVAVVGAEAGSNLSHLIEDGHDLVAWGNVTDIVVSGTPVLEPAADETVSEQVRALSSTVIKEVSAELARLAQ
jgi:hypothetical protein